MGDERSDPYPDSEDQGRTESMMPGGPPDADAGASIGPYRLLQRIGEGGMGEVWVAEQSTPVRRRVALKLIKAGMDTRQVIARFEQERQALALMDHAAIARVFDAGTTAAGRPYFVMEYVPGVPLNEHCDRLRLTTDERMRLFMQVCEGVQHAHHKAIIHRDLKPSNILVTVQDGKARPKIIDFGVAKATAQPLTERTVFTEQGVLIGTPEYMSPEQADLTAQDVDTRTDVYSLGAILYELLVGALPFDARLLRLAGFDEIRRRIREDEPARPSARLATLGAEVTTESARRRRVDPLTLRRQLRGDLDWITMKALEKDRTRRYSSPADLAADIARHLGNEPVMAGPPSTAYRVGKFVRRHRAGVAVAALFVVLLLAFTVTTAIQSRRIAREARTATKVSEFLADMLGSSDPQLFGNALWKDLKLQAGRLQRARGASARETEAALAAIERSLAGINATDVALDVLDEQILSPAARTIATSLSGEPYVAARLEGTLGRTYQRLGRLDSAQVHLERAAHTMVATRGQRSPEALQARAALADILRERGRLGEADSLFRAVLAEQERVLGKDALETATTRLGLGRVMNLTNQDARPMLEAALGARRRILGSRHPDTIDAMLDLAGAQCSRGRYGDAETLYREAIASSRAAFGDDDRRTADAVSGLAWWYYEQDRFTEAESLYAEGLATYERALGGDHPTVTNARNDLAGAYFGQGRYDRVESIMLEVIQTEKRVMGPLHINTLKHQSNLGSLYVYQNRFTDAERILSATLASERQVLGPSHSNTVRTMETLSGVYMQEKRVDRARPVLADLLSGRRTLAEKSTNARAKNAYAWLAVTVEPKDMRQPAMALPFALEANRLTDFSNWEYLSTLARAYFLLDSVDKAVEVQKQVLAHMRETDEDRPEEKRWLAAYEKAKR